MSLLFGLSGDRDTDKELHRIADHLAKVFGHTRDEAEEMVRSFYLAVTRPDGALWDVTRWTDDDFWHEGINAAYYVQYHLEPGYRRVKSIKFLHWQRACYDAYKAGGSMPPVPEPDPSPGHLQSL